MGIADLPKAKWSAANEQVILKDDFVDIEAAILESFEQRRPPSLSWVDAGSVKVLASTDAPAKAMLNGFPNLWHPGQFIDGGLCDGKYRVVTSDVTLALASTLWGSEKASQWYAILAIAGDADAAFTLKAMPFLRVQGEAAQVISCGLNATPATDNDYGFTNDEFVDSVLYVISGAKKGQVRTITANNVASSTSTITYSGTALSLSQGDWFIILPATNSKFLGSIFNDSSSDIVEFTQDGDRFYFAAAVTSLVYTGDIRAACPLATLFLVEHPTVATGYGGAAPILVTVNGTPVGLSPDGDAMLALRSWATIANCVFTGSGSLATYNGHGFAYAPGILA